MRHILCFVTLTVVLVLWECAAQSDGEDELSKGGSSGAQLDNLKQGDRPTTEVKDIVTLLSKGTESVIGGASEHSPKDNQADPTAEPNAAALSDAKEKGDAEPEEGRGKPGLSSLTGSDQTQINQIATVDVQTLQTVISSTVSETPLTDGQNGKGSKMPVSTLTPGDSAQQSHGGAALREGAEHEVSSTHTSSPGKQGKKGAPAAIAHNNPKAAAHVEDPTGDRRHIKNEDDHMSAQPPIVPETRLDNSRFTQTLGTQGIAGSPSTHTKVDSGTEKIEKPVPVLPKVIPHSQTIDQSQHYAKHLSHANALNDARIAVDVPSLENPGDILASSKALQGITKDKRDVPQIHVPSPTNKDDVDITTSKEKDNDTTPPVDNTKISTAPTTALHTMSNALPVHNSVDKTDGILCSSSLFALAALATLAVAAAAPAH